MTAFEFAPLPAVHTEDRFREFLQRLDGYFETVNQSRTQLSWAKIWHEPYDSDAQERIDQASDLLYSASHHETIQEWKDKARDPYVKRWAEVLDRDFVLARLEQQPDLRKIVNHISDRYLGWRPKVDGQEVSYTRQTWIFRHEADREIRRKAWVAFEELGEELKDITREMFQLRNEGARKLGYSTYADLKLQLADDVSRQWLVDRFTEMETVTEPVFVGYLQRQADREGLSEVQPWDVQYLLDRDPWVDLCYFPAERLQENLFACAASLGLDSAALGIRLYWYDSAFGGQCMSCAPQDIRVMISKGDGMLYYNTAYHEYGHALHSAYNDQPFTLRRESGLFVEGMAMFMEQFLHYPSWLLKMGVPGAEIDRYRETRKLPRMYRHRRLAATVMAELAAWDDPTQDLNQVFGETTRRYLSASFQPRPFAAVTRWTWPVRLQSYFIADLIASQTHAFLRSHFSPIFDKPDAIGHVRDHYWRPGNSIPWLEKIRRCTGKDLAYDDLGLEMTGPLPDA